MGVDPPVSKVLLKQEVEPAGFKKDQTASEITRCASAERSTEEPFEWKGHGLPAEEFRQQRWRLEDRAQDGQRRICSLAPARGLRQIASPFPLQLLPLDAISSSY